MNTEPEYDYNDNYTINEHYMNKINITLCRSMEAYPRLMVVFAIGRLPDDYADIDTLNIPSDFMASLVAQVQADLKRKAKKGIRTYPCKVRSVWVREFDKEPGLEEKKHYHLMLTFNKDAYAFLGDYKALDGNLSSMIRKAWCRALHVDYPENRSLLVFPDKNPTYFLLSKEGKETEKYRKFIYHASYLAKEETKRKGDGKRNFGCSQR